jgi:hypothetical protein
MQINKIQLLKKVVRIIFLAAMSSSLWYCANVIAPKGGPKDETPPQLISEESTPNMKTNFTKQDITFVFEEWVELNDVFNQIVISPPIEKKDYEVKIKGKSIIFSFTESAELRENATYTINFGEAIRDITEKNPVENLRYVFSTGGYIDSLIVRGNIIDAKTSAPVEGAFFMLYENLADSVVQTINPFYFGRTDESGNFIIENVRGGTFKGFAIKRTDQNYKYDNPAEMIGFPDNFIVVGDTTGIVPDSTGRMNIKPTIVPTIRLFQEQIPLYVSDVDSSQYGYLNLTFNDAPNQVDLSYEGLVTVDNTPPRTLTEKDSIHIWFEQANSERWQLLVRKDSLLNDTIQVKVRDKQNYLDNGLLNFIPARSTKQGKINPANPLKIGFSQPITSFDTTFINLLEDTTLQKIQPVFSIDSLTGRNLLIAHQWKESLPYALEILPGGVTDLFGLRNRDTIEMKYSADRVKAFGNIKIKINGLKDSLAYLGELLDKTETVIRSFEISGTETFELSVNSLTPGNYKIKIIIDLNNNGIWDTGSYDAKRQAEPIFEKPLDQLRANWDVEVKIDMNQG